PGEGDVEKLALVGRALVWVEAADDGRVGGELQRGIPRLHLLAEIAHAFAQHGAAHREVLGLIDRSSKLTRGIAAAPLGEGRRNRDRPHGKQGTGSVLQSPRRLPQAGTPFGGSVAPALSWRP